MLPETKLDIMLARHASLEAELSRPLGADIFVKLTRELAEIAPVVEKVKAYRNAVSDLADLDAIIADPATDTDLRAVAAEEKPVVEARRVALAHDIQLALIPKDAMDDKNVILEIRAGTGGDEASLFAGDLFRMYERYAAKHGWKAEILSASVAVLPEVADVDVGIEDKDLRIETMRSQGAGGQHVNKTESAIRITHLPSGIVVMMQEERSQHRNRAKAMGLLRAKLYDAERQRLDAARAAERRGQVGSGDRSERIRTYNFPQGRVTDHRINLTLYKLPQVIEGESLDEFIDALVTERQASLLAAQDQPSGGARV